ncbi:MAG: response regulator [Myxococcales bacterium]|nr:response regulator [Myxococcales bacterium]
MVDDNAELASALEAVLLTAPRGLTVRTASRGAEALEVAKDAGFDVAIVDVKLPDASGVDLIEPLRAASPFGEVVLITGFASVDAAIGALRSGAFAFVLKSFRPEELISTVEQALSKVRLQRERRVLEKRAADAEALSAMGKLALNLAHEIRNPLNAAVLQLHLLARDIDRLEANPETRAALKRRGTIVGDEIGRLSRLLTEFLELARPRGLAREPVHLGRLVEDVIELEQDAATSRGVTVKKEIAPDGCVALGDAAKLKQVVLNLVVNALEAMKAGGELTARVAPVDEQVVLVVEDTGPGIAPEVLESVFDPFFTTKEAGTGLGLSIVRNIVDQHMGDVRIESVAGRGTRVIVRVPIGR